MPRTFGDGLIHVSHIDSLVEVEDHELYCCRVALGTVQEQKIGRLIAENLVDNGATLELGI